MRQIAAIALAASVAGCAVPISSEKIDAADYGEPPPANHQDIIRKRISSELRDPYSAVFEFDAPRLGYLRTNPVAGTTEAFGWRVCGTVNAKNAYGAYRGRSPFFALFRGDRLIALIESIDDPSSPLIYGIRGACERVVNKN